MTLFAFDFSFYFLSFLATARRSGQVFLAIDLITYALSITWKTKNPLHTTQPIA